jgi:hypothetical protein
MDMAEQVWGGDLHLGACVAPLTHILEPNTERCLASPDLRVIFDNVDILILRHLVAWAPPAPMRP